MKQHQNSWSQKIYSKHLYLRNAALAKEEVAKLDDIQNQLNDQRALLKQQHNDADELIKLKEEQIKILEAQLAQ